MLMRGAWEVPPKNTHSFTFTSLFQVLKDLEFPQKLFYIIELLSVVAVANTQIQNEEKQLINDGIQKGDIHLK